MSRNSLYQIGIVGIALLLFLPTSTVHLFDWDEINFAEAAREMILTGDYLTVTIDFQPFWEKPPLYIWMQVLSMKVFGVTEFAARLPNIICGIATLLVLFNLGKRIYNEKFGLIWVMAYLGALLPQVYFMSGIIDPFYNLFIFLALYCTYEFWTSESGRHLIYAAVWTGLAVLTKGPVALLILFSIVVVHSIIRGGNGVLRAIFTSTMGWLALATFVVICSLFYGAEFIRHGPTFFTEFVDYHIRLLGSNEAGHGQPFYYHFIILLIGCLPLSVLMLGGFSRGRDEGAVSDFARLMMIMFFVVLGIFSMVSTKIIHYSSLCYFPLTFLAARYIYNVSYRKMQHLTKLTIGLLVGSGLFSLILIILPTVMSDVSALSPYIKDSFAVANLQADVSWSWMDSVGGFIYFFGLIIFVYLVSRGRLKVAYAALLISTTLGINIAFKTIVPKVELITQNAAIEFYESLEDEDCYLDVLDFKSYAQFYYGRKLIAPSMQRKTRVDLLEGPLDKTAYFVVKNIDADKYRDHPNLTLLYEKNGFVFFKRSPD